MANTLTCPECQAEIEITEVMSAQLAADIRGEVELRVRVWRQVAGCEGFHARYLMSESVGVRVDWGFSEGELGTTTDVELMSGSLHKQRWGEFQQQSSPFHLQHDITFA